MNSQDSFIGVQDSRQAAVDYLQAWYNNPARFAWDVFGIESWERQQEMLESPVHHDHFAWKTGPQDRQVDDGIHHCIMVGAH